MVEDSSWQRASSSSERPASPAAWWPSGSPRRARRPCSPGGPRARCASWRSASGTEWRVADALRRNSVFALLERGDVLVSTVGPFAKWGEPAVRAAIAAQRHYIDSTGEPAFIRRVFEEFGPPADARRRDAADRHGLRLRAGRARRRAGAARRPARRPCASTSATTRSAPGSAPARAARRSGSCSTRATRSATARCGTLADRRARALVHTSSGKDRDAVSIGGSEQLTLPASYPAAARGQRLPRLVRRRSRGRCRPAAWPARWR